jgi:hypothetical protein
MAAETPTHTTISPDLLLPELLRDHPGARVVLDRHGLRGCGGRLGPYESIRFFAHVHGVDEAQLLAELELAKSAHPSDDPAMTPGPSSLADTIYRRYFIGGILLTLTAGATWGAWMLWTVALTGTFRGLPVHSVNAHGEAQIFGWIGLFIMGFAYQAFPRIWQTTLAAPRLASCAFAAIVAGLIARTLGTWAAGAWDFALPVAIAGAALEVVAVLLFTGQILATFAMSGARLEPYVGYLMGALAWFVAASLMGLWHTWNTMSAQSPDELVWYVATYQAPLRDLQVHGLALFMILGVALRMMPTLFDLPRVPDRRAWWALDLLITAVAGEVVLFLLYRWTHNHTFATCLFLPRAMLAAGAAMVVLPWRPWRPFPVRDRSAKFVRAAFAWLAVSLAMLLLLPAHRAISGLPFSHAYYGAIRHAITVGFVSLMIMGMAAKIVPMLNGVDPRALSRLWGPFLLVNAGCFLRIVLQALTDWSGAIYPLLGVSGTLEVAGLAWWGFGLITMILRGRLAAGAAPASTRMRPERVEGHHVVGDVLDWFPAAEPILVRHGFLALRQPLSRQTLARQVTIAQAASLRGIAAETLLDALNAAVDRERQSPESAGCESKPILVQIGAKP